MTDIALLLDAASFAAQRHAGQFRKGAERTPYINHPLEVARLLASVGNISDIDVLRGALLHDTVEDTSTSPEELEERFGPAVRRLVEEVTDDKSLEKARRKELQVEHTPHISSGAKLIKLGDKIANVVDVTDHPPSDWLIERRREYLDWTEAVVAGCRGVNPALEHHYDDVLARGRECLGQRGLLRLLPTMEPIDETFADPDEGLIPLDDIKL